jgi:hypothetical protein|tara:strand:- start:771 stop:1346 length:576 start_codon:yes stop_codon:yes gene_type:complete
MADFDPETFTKNMKPRLKDLGRFRGPDGYGYREGFHKSTNRMMFNENKDESGSPSRGLVEENWETGPLLPRRWIHGKGGLGPGPVASRTGGPAYHDDPIAAGLMGTSNPATVLNRARFNLMSAERAAAFADAGALPGQGLRRRSPQGTTSVLHTARRKMMEGIDEIDEGRGVAGGNDKNVYQAAKRGGDPT